jgi:hypothetical protein
LGVQLQVNLTRFYGVFAPYCNYRAQVRPAERGKGNNTKESDEPQSSVERRASMTWVQRLKLVFHTDIATCRQAVGWSGSCPKHSLRSRGKHSLASKT